ncbi:MAG: hypothetical protein WKF37_01295 [Bryobacteraceae bacterium]
MAARLMSRRGFKIIAIIEWDAAVYNPNGLNIESLMEHRRRVDPSLTTPVPSRSIARKLYFLTAMCSCRLQRRM